MEKNKVYNFLFCIIGLIFAKLWRDLLKNINISEFFKWVTGIGIIIFIFLIINKVKNLINSNKDNIKNSYKNIF